MGSTDWGHQPPKGQIVCPISAPPFLEILPADWMVQPKIRAALLRDSSQVGTRSIEPVAHKQFRRQSLDAIKDQKYLRNVQRMTADT